MEKKHVTVGPFGGEGGSPWNDGTYSGVKQVVICAGSIVDSVQIEYDQNGCSVWSKKHGDSPGGDKHIVKLDYPGEYLTSISGYFGERCNYIVLQCLILQTNKKTYGPYGKKKGKFFSFPSVEGKIVGFHGRSGAYLESIGAYYEPFKFVSVGPFGGLGGQSWDDGAYTTVRQMIIHVGDALDSILIEYDRNGRSKWSAKHGLSPGGNRHVVKLDFPNEFIISVSGYLTDDCAKAVVRSLMVETNKRQYGPFGAQKGKHFSTSSTIGQIVGFHGRSGRLVDSIGVHIQPIKPQIHPVSAGPCGGHGGNKWDDGIYSTVRQLVIYSGGATIDSIRIEYDKYGRSVWSEKHGESTGGVQNLIKLDYPSEFIISVSGYYNSDCGLNVIRSLKIETNKKTYGPFGQEVGNHFSIPNEGGKVVGFHGRSGLYVDSIGVHYEPIPNPSHFKSIGPIGGHCGSPWDDGAYTTIRQLIIYCGDVIESLQIEYDNKGRSKWSEKHGRSQCGNKNIVKLDYPGEFLLTVSGYYSDFCGTIVVRSLKIESNKRTYGPFGVEEGTPFKIPSEDGKIIGFHGRSGEYLVSIGAYYESFPNP